MSETEGALVSLRVGHYRLAVPLGCVAQVMPVAAMRPASRALPEAPLVGELPQDEQVLPVLDGHALLHGAPGPAPAWLMVLRAAPVAVAVTEMGEVLAPQTFTVWPLPAWLARQAVRRAVLHLVQAQGWWIVVDCARMPFAAWAAAWARQASGAA